MTYAAQLIDAVKDACGFESYTAMATAIGVDKTSLSQWRHGKGSPMPEERVLELCKMAKIADHGPWLLAIHGEAAKNATVRKELLNLLDRVRPSIARAAMLGAVLLGYFALPLQAHAMPTMQPEQAQAICIMRSNA